MSETMQRIVLASRPEGAPSEANFRLETGEVPRPGENEVLVRVRWLSLDPYMRGRMDAGKSYAKPVEIGATMEGGAVGEVVASNHKGFAPGDAVMGMLGWASHGVLPGDQLRKLDPSLAPPQTALGVLGMPGFTGWYGFTQIGQPKAGETLVVGAATGAVGSMVGQLAKARGLRAVGIAGGEEKCRYAVENLGFDACLDHHALDAKGMREALKGACPDGIDIYFENVGGKTLEAVLGQMNVGGRIPVCGVIAWYDLGGLGAGGGLEGPDNLPKAWRAILVNRLKVQGFIIMDHWNRLGDFVSEVAPMLADGRVTYRESVAEGLEAAPGAFLSMLKGGNFGKQLVKVAE
jgi:NADPH-dependent curcumin reductase CurA